MMQHQQSVQESHRKYKSQFNARLSTSPSFRSSVDSTSSYLSSNTESSSMSYLCHYSNTDHDNRHSISPKIQIHAKTMELLSHDEEDDDDKSIKSDDDDIAQLNDSNLRIHKLSNTQNSVELEQVLREQYAQNDEGMEEDDESDLGLSASELSENEIREIERRKTDRDIHQQKKNNYKSTPRSQSLRTPNLLRFNTKSPWNDDQIEKLQNDMRKELLSLKDINTNKDKSNKTKNLKNYKIVISGSVSSANEDDDDETTSTSASNLFRAKSRDKWDALEMDQTKEDMERAMFDLMKASKRNKNKNKNNNNNNNHYREESIASSILSIPSIPSTRSGIGSIAGTIMIGDQ